MGKSHTDAATINLRRPLTSNMREALRRLAEGPLSERDRILSQGLSNAVKALRARGYATWSQERREHSITDSGRRALSNKKD